MKRLKRIKLGLLVISFLVLLYNIIVTYNFFKSVKSIFSEGSKLVLNVNNDELIANSKYEEQIKPVILKRTNKTEAYFDLELNYEKIDNSFMLTTDALNKEQFNNLTITGYSEDHQNVVKVHEGTIPFTKKIYLKNKNTKKIRIYLSWDENKEKTPNLVVRLKLNQVAV